MRAVIPEIRLLSVEDDPADRNLIREVLEREIPQARVHVAFATSGDEALALLDATDSGHPAPDGLLLDLNLPGRNGLEILLEVRRHPKLAKLPIVVLTTSVQDTDARACLENGATAFFTKPFEVTQLAGVLSRVVDVVVETRRKGGGRPAAAVRHAAMAFCHPRPYPHSPRAAF